MSTLKKIGNALDTDDDKGVVIAVAVALIIISAVVAGYYIYHVLYQPPEGFTSISVLDENGKAVNYGDTFVVGQPTTFNVTVANHEGATQQYEVQVKVTNETLPQFPVDVTPENTYTKTVANGGQWETNAVVTLHETGAQNIIFELWTINNAGGLDFTDNYLVLHVQGVNPS